MNAIQGHTLPSHLLAELAMHLRTSGSLLTVTEAATAAIRAWIGASTQPSTQQLAAPTPEQQVSACAGYQWKSLFLPSGTELRMSTRESTCHARVVGDDIIFGGRRVSPRAMTLAVAGNGRNAWRDLWLKMPGQTRFLPASRLRREHERVAAGLPPNPAAQMIESMLSNVAGAGMPADDRAKAPPKAPPDVPAAEAEIAFPAEPDRHQADHAATIAAAAVTMSAALKTMLALMERLSVRGMADEDRRINRARREEDILADDCAFD